MSDNFRVHFPVLHLSDGWENIIIMRVIAGSARRLTLIAPEGMDTRPTGDKIRETLFNMLQWKLPGASFLDLFSGSGAIAIEALSRGAKCAVMVEHNRKAAACIRKNLETTGFTESGELMISDVFAAIRRLEDTGRQFDMIYMDPPFRHMTEGSAATAPSIRSSRPNTAPRANTRPTIRPIRSRNAIFSSPRSATGSTFFCS